MHVSSEEFFFSSPFGSKRPDISSLYGNLHSLLFHKQAALDQRALGMKGSRGPGFRASQVCLLYTASGNNGRAKYLIYTPDPGTHLQIIKAGSWQRGESGNCNGCSQFIP